MATRELKVNIVGDSRSLERALGQSTKGTHSFGSSLLKLGKYAAISAGVAGVGGLAIALKRGYDEMASGQLQAAQTAAALKSTGGAANVTAKQVSNLATEISRYSGIDDEAVQAGENMLLTFTNIRNEAGKNNDIFNQASKTLADLATRMSGGVAPSMETLNKSAIQLGKALNDPIKGMGALRRVGVQFTEDQQKQITALVKSGKTMEAQKLILKELQTEFGGSAKAAGETFPGQLAKLRNAFDEAAGSLTAALLPAATKVFGFLADAIPVATGYVSRFFKEFGAAEGLSGKLGVVADSFKGLFSSLKETLLGSTETIRSGAGFITIPTEGIAQKFADDLTESMGQVNWEAFGQRVIDGLNTGLQRVGEISKNIASAVLAAVRQIDWNAVGREMGPGLAAAVTVAFTTLMDPAFWIKNWDLALAIALVAFGGSIGRLGGKLVAPFTKMGADAVVSISEGLARVSPRLAELFLAMMARLPRLALAPFAQLIKLTVDTFGRLGRLAVFTVKVLGVVAAINVVVGMGRKIGGELGRLAGEAYGWALSVGKAIIQGMYDGIMARLNGLLGAAQTVIDKIKGILSFKWGSPPETYGHEVGSKVTEGMGKGLLDNVKKVADAARKVIESAQQAVASARGDFASAFSSLASAAMAAFDSAMSQWKPKAQIKLDKMQLADQKKQIKDAVKDANQAIIDAQREGAANMAKAQQDLAKAIAGGDPEEIANAQAAVLQAQKDGTTQLLNAQQQRADALRAQQEFNLGQEAARQQAAHDKRAAVERIQLEQDLAQLQAQLAKHPEQYKRIHAQILRELNEHGKNLGVTQAYWGTVAGIEMAHGIDQAIQVVVAACKKLARAIERLLKLKRKGSWDTEEGPMSDFGHWFDMFGPGLVEGIEAGIPGVRKAAKGVGLAASVGLGEGLQTAYAGQIIQNLISPSDVSSAVGLGQGLASGVGTALSTVAAQKDALAKNFTDFTAQAQTWSGTTVSQVGAISTAFQNVRNIATTVWGAALASLKANIKEFQDPTARIAAMFQSVADAVGAIGSQAYATRNALRDTVADILNLLKQLQEGGGLQPPGMQSGGAVRAGSPYIVGEAGPELFVPNTSGRIVPGVSSGTPFAAGGMTVNVYTGTVLGTERDVEDAVRRAMYNVNRRNPGLGFALG